VLETNIMAPEMRPRVTIIRHIHTSAEPVPDQVARHFQDRIRQKEQSCAQGVTSVRDMHVRLERFAWQKPCSRDRETQ
jgi:hypothetical protein